MARYSSMTQLPFVGCQPQVGDVYIVSTRGHTGGLDLSVQSEARVVKMETITVPAGTFLCFRIKNKTVLKALNARVKSSKSKSTSWFAPNVGIVKTKVRKHETVLTNYFIGDNASP